MDELSIFILTGGQSTRMGRDKALLNFEGKRLIEHAVKSAAIVSKQVFIVGDAEKYEKFGQIVEDIYRDRGPLGGIHAALRSTQMDYNLMLAVDMPFVSHELLEFLARKVHSNQCVVTVPESGSRLQPLCAGYNRQFLTIAEQALARGENKITPLFEKVKTQVISSQELRRAGFGEHHFRNWNTSTDIETEISVSKERY